MKEKIQDLVKKGYAWEKKNNSNQWFIIYDNVRRNIYIDYTHKKYDSTEIFNISVLLRAIGDEITCKNIERLVNSL